MSEAAHKRSRWRLAWRCCKVLVVAAAFAAIAYGALYWYERWQLTDELSEVIAQLDRDEPDWQWEALRKKREAPPDDQNGALIVRAAAAKLRGSWGSNPLWNKLDELPPAIRADAKMVKELRLDVAPIAPVLPEARKLLDCPSGRFAIPFPRPFRDEQCPHLREARSLADALFHETRLLMAEGKITEALTWCRVMLHDAETCLDEAFISLLVRIAIQSMAIHRIEQALALGETDAETLRGIHEALRRADATDHVTLALRGERALLHQLFLDLADGSLTPANFDWYTAEKMEDCFSGNEIRRSHAYILPKLTALIDAARLPDEKRYQALDTLRKEHKAAEERDEIPCLAKLFLPAIPVCATTDRAHRSHLHCAIVAIAAERFRVATGRWPASAQELMDAKLLDAVPWIFSPVNRRAGVRHPTDLSSTPSAQPANTKATRG